MRMLIWLVGVLLAVPAGTAQAQPAPQSHEQHQASGQHETPTGGEKCCCEEMMRKMMAEMMQKHQGKGMEMPKGVPPADKDRAQ